jgi:ribosome biogenesis GTPase
LGNAPAAGERFRAEDEESFRSDERVLPKGSREKSPRSRRRIEADSPSLAGDGVDETTLVSGVVEAFRGQLAEVLTDDGLVRCAVRGRLETADSEDRSLLVVGDRVGIALTAPNEGVIELVRERERVLIRADKRVKRFRHIIAANIDKVILITSVSEPAFRPGIVDRFLVAASSQELPAALVMNKTDLASSETLRQQIERNRMIYASVGLEVILTSAVRREGLDAFDALLRSARGVLVGHSGVGKSSLLNALDPALELPAQDVNRKTLKGTHTTSVAQMLHLSSGIDVIDTPGLRELGIFDVASVDLEAHFPEFLPLLSSCEMDNCAHTVESGCAVRKAVEDELVSLRRYQSYVDIRAELESVERDHVR